MTSGAPAKPWYDLVVQTLALKGWTKAELTGRSEVAKTTIDNWARNPRKPQARSVNAVADVLGIPRERALRLAGIITAPGDSAAPVPPELRDMPDLVEPVRRRYPDPDVQARVLEAMAAAVRSHRPDSPTAPGPGETGRAASRGEEAG